MIETQAQMGYLADAVRIGRERQLTDRQILLGLLIVAQKHGHGVSSLAIRDLRVTANPSERVRELKQRGIEIGATPVTDRRTGRRFTIYTLKGRYTRDDVKRVRGGVDANPDREPKSAKPPKVDRPDPSDGRLFSPNEYGSYGAD